MGKKHARMCNIIKWKCENRQGMWNMCINCNVMETKTIGLISHDDYPSYDSSYEDESVDDEDDDAITQSGLIENFDKTDQDILTHELKNDDSESSECDDEEENGDESSSVGEEEVEDEEEEGLKNFFWQISRKKIQQVFLNLINRRNRRRKNWWT